MGTKTSPPRCQFCGNVWYAPIGTPPAFDYCHKCSAERHRRAQIHFGIDRKPEFVTTGRYLIRKQGDTMTNKKEAELNRLEDDKDREWARDYMIRKAEGRLTPDEREFIPFEDLLKELATQRG